MPGYMVVPTDSTADIGTTLDDRIEDKFMDTIIVHTQKGKLEERLGAAELVLAHSDDLAVWHNASPGKRMQQQACLTGSPGQNDTFS